jgi:hypothetical protein
MRGPEMELSKHVSTILKAGKNRKVVRHVTGNDEDYLRKIPRVVW